MTGSRPPVAPREPAAAADPYAWMRDKDQPAMREYLAAERAYYEQQTAPLRELREDLFAELAARLLPAEESVRWRQGAFWYFTQTVAGQELGQFCRAPGPDGPGEVLLDENLLLTEPAAAGSYAELGVREVSPDGRYLAYSVDFDGDEVYQLRIRDLAAGADLAERIERSYYGLAWGADSRSLLYVVTDEAYRPHQVWRHELGTAPDRDTLVFTEDDERFELTVRATRSGAWLLIETASRDTTETLLIPAGDTGVAPFVIEPRRPGTEYYADHAGGPDGGELYLVTNAGAAEFRLVRAPITGPGQAGWTEVIGAAGDTRLVRCDVFGRYLVVEQRHAAATQLRVVDRETGAQRLIEADGPEQALALAVNEEYTAAAVTVRTESLTGPPGWHDVDLASGRWVLRKRQEVPGYDPAQYVTERISAPAPDGTPIPVTVAYRRGLRRDGSAPALLYGYGAYEAPSWPEFAVTTPSLLDRGFVYAVAHVRGGGEGGRRWWAQGRLDRKRTTFTDFIAAAGLLAGEGWAAPDRIVSRGLSAGGLLQGAVFSMAPERWRAVVAEVPFVDVVTTMLDPSIPLTISEWDEWGDPRDPAMRAYLASYSPYDNVPDGPRPDLLVTGSLHDPRVLIHEPAKWVARLRATDTAGSRVLFRAELGAGAHVGPAGRYDQLRYEAEILSFILTAAAVA
ncbi:MAG TPA: prolyl oligopeptidase family serine peptidase [Streptosporangiaceae bacterium]|nr:prolyl oligopeptidase family serine peptidase [Streptosporangiaceae bacterium]